MRQNGKDSLQWQITADKRLRYAPLKLPSETSFIRKPLGETVALKYGKILR
jgi:hypothetical protein